MFDGVCGTGNNRTKLEEGDFYMSDDGYMVFTEKYHLKRGYCCKSGCKHCPYGYDKNTGRFRKKSEAKTGGQS